jgi:hypothetical protein
MFYFSRRIKYFHAICRMRRGGGTTYNVITDQPLCRQRYLQKCIGKVFESDGTTPIANAFLAIYTYSSSRSELTALSTPYKTMTTASDGSYLFTDIPQGNAYIAMWKNEGEYLANPNNPSGANNVTIVNVNIIIIIINNNVLHPFNICSNSPPVAAYTNHTSVKHSDSTNTPALLPLLQYTGCSAPTDTNTLSAPHCGRRPCGRVYTSLQMLRCRCKSICNGKTGTTDANGYYPLLQ